MARKYNPNSFITETGFIIRLVEKKRLSKTQKLVHSTTDDVTLDLGCGAGNLLPFLKGKKIVGYDLSDYMLALAAQRAQGMSHIEIVKGNAEQLPFSDNTFTRVVCSEVLEHVKNPDQVIKEIIRVCQDQARVVITLPNEELINGIKRWVLRLGLKKWVAGRYNMSDNMLDEWHLNEIEPDWVKKLHSTKFSYERCVSIPTIFTPLHRIYLFTVHKSGLKN